MEIRVKRLLIMFMALCMSIAPLSFAVQYPAGDLAPQGAPDGQVNVNDLLLLERFVYEAETMTLVEQRLGDLAPLSSPDGIVNINDILMLNRILTGEVSVPPINILPTAPVLDPIVSPTTQNPFVIAGTASPGATVVVYVNNAEQHQVTANANTGVFSIGVYLFDGVNTLYTREFDGVDYSLNSNQLLVQYDNTINRSQGGAITQDTVWTPGIPEQPYVISSDLVVNAGVKLVLQPGTVLQFERSSPSNDLVVNGELIAQGSLEDGFIYFTSNEAAPNDRDWQGISVNSSATSVVLDYVVIEYAYTGVSFSNVSNAVLKNSRIENIDGIGVSLSNTSPEILNNLITNTYTGLSIQLNSSPTIAQNVIASNNTGVRFLGDRANVSNNPTPVIRNNSIYDNVTNAYADSYFDAMNTVLDVQRNWWGSADIMVITEKLSDFSSVSTLNSDRPVLDFANFLDSENGMPVSVGSYLNGPINTDTIIPAGSQYAILGSVLIPEGLSLTVQEGAILSFANGRKIRAEGDLIAQGTSSNPVTFTSIRPSVKQSKDWYGIELQSTAVNSRLDNVLVEYAEYGIYQNGVSIDVTNSVMRFNERSGLYLQNSSPNITNNIITTNGGSGSGDGHGLSIRAGSNPVVSNNTIRDNKVGVYVRGNNTLAGNPNPVVTNNRITREGLFGFRDYLYQASAFANPAQTVLDASNNWWGTTDVTEIAERIGDFTDDTSAAVVDYTPFLDAADGVPVSGEFLTGTLQGDTTLLIDTDYTVIGSLTVPAGVVLTIPAGASLRFVDGAALYVDGSLQIQGTANNKVLLGSLEQINPLRGEWLGIFIRNGANNILIDHAIIQHASVGISMQNADGVISNNIIRESNAGIRLTDASPDIRANEIVTNSRGIEMRNHSAPAINNGNKIIGNDDGIVILGDYTAASTGYPVITDNSIYDNTDDNLQTTSCFGSPKSYTFSAINNWWGTTDLYDIEAKISHQGDNINCAYVDYSGYLLSETGAASQTNLTVIQGVLSQNTIFQSNQTYLVSNWLTVPQGVTLTIQAGAEVLFARSNARLIIQGTLDVQGVSSNPVIFSTARQLPETVISDTHWYGIQIDSNATNVVIDYAVIEYADRGVFFNTGAGVLRNSLITRNEYGVYISGSQSVEIRNNTIMGNQYGIYLNGNVSDPQPVIRNNNIYSNINDNIFFQNIEPGIRLDLSDNWWDTNDINVVISSLYSNNENPADLVTVSSIATDSYGAALPLKNVRMRESYISPGVSPGEKDTARFEAELSKPGSWLVQIVNNAGAVIRSYSGNTPVLDITWDGRNTSSVLVADGVYRIYAIVDGVSRLYKFIVVDNTLPVTNILSPLQNATIDDLPHLQISGTATDANIELYEVAYANSFTQNNADFIRPVIVSSNFSKQNSRLSSWLFYNEGAGFLVQPGNKTIRVLATDKAGNTHASYVQFVFDYPGISNVSHSPKTINPVKAEISTINFTAGTPGTLTLKIYPERTSGGDIIYEEERILSTAGNYSMTWDGKTTSGDYVGDEAYRFELELSNGINTIVYKELKKNTSSPRALSFRNGFSITKNRFFKFEVAHSAFTRLSLGIGSTGGEAIAAPYDRVPFESGPSWLYWDGRDASGAPLKPSQITFGISADGQTLSPLSIIVTGTRPLISGGGALPNIEIQPSSYKVRHSYNEISEINYQIDQDADVTIKLLPPGIYDPADNRAIIIESTNRKSAETTPGVPAVHSFIWRGHDVTDLNNIVTSEEGHYTFTIEASSVETGNTSLYRGNLSLFK